MNELARRISVLAAGHGAVDFYLPVISVILPVLILVFATQGITLYAMPGFLVTVITLTLAVVQPVSGWLQDNGKWTLGAIWSVLMTAVAISLLAFIQKYTGFFYFSLLLRALETPCIIRMRISRSICSQHLQTGEHCCPSSRSAAVSGTGQRRLLQVHFWYGRGLPVSSI